MLYKRSVWVEIPLMRIVIKDYTMWLKCQQNVYPTITTKMYTRSPVKELIHLDLKHIILLLKVACLCASIHTRCHSFKRQVISEGGVYEILILCSSLGRVLVHLNSFVL